jgi:hypothetical protein
MHYGSIAIPTHQLLSTPDDTHRIDMYPRHAIAAGLPPCRANHLDLTALAEERLPLDIRDLQYHLPSPSTIRKTATPSPTPPHTSAGFSGCLILRLITKRIRPIPGLAGGETEKQKFHGKALFHLSWRHGGATRHRCGR